MIPHAGAHCLNLPAIAIEYRGRVLRQRNDPPLRRGLRLFAITLIVLALLAVIAALALAGKPPAPPSSHSSGGLQ